MSRKSVISAIGFPLVTEPEQKKLKGLKILSSWIEESKDRLAAIHEGKLGTISYEELKKKIYEPGKLD